MIRFAEPITNKVLSTLSRFEMIEPGELVLVAVSGGPDSVTLLHLLHSLAGELGIVLHAAHLNHQFRGAEADADARFVGDFCKSLNIPASIRSFDVPAYLAETKLSAQEGARNVRYAFLEEVAEEIGAARIAIAHTADDQVETVLINLLRGSGTDGLRGMPPVREKIIRPLIECWRSEIVEYCRLHGLSPREDSSNVKPIYLRNRVRAELIPYIEANFKSELCPLLLRMSEMMRDDSELLSALGAEALEGLIEAASEGRIELDRVGLIDLDPSIGRRALRDAIRRVKGDLAEIGFEVIEEILSLAQDATFKINLPDNLFVEGDEATVTIYKPSTTEPVPSIEREIAIPGVTVVEELEIALDAREVAQVRGIALDQGPWIANLDLDKIELPLVVRNRRSGDRFAPLGLGGSRKLQDVLVDRKVPQGRRDRVALIADKHDILWIPGFTISEKARITQASTRVLELSAVTRNCSVLVRI